MGKYKYSGIYTSIYSFFDQFPELKPLDWDGPEFCDTEDMKESLPNDYNVVYGGDWSLASLDAAATILIGQTYIDFNQNLIVFHNDQSEEILTTILDSMGLTFIYKQIQEKR